MKKKNIFKGLQAKADRKAEDSGSGAKSFYQKAQKTIGFIAMFLFHMRKVIMAIPVLYYALKLAQYNSEHLPEEVGLFLQSSGEFAQMIDKNLAISAPLMLTGGCLVLMFFSRKAMYSWAISIFTLALPVLLLISNIYPA